MSKTVMHKGEVTRVRYRVDILLPTTGSYVEYTSRKGVDLAFATSLADGLKRQDTGGRVVEVPTGVVKDEWVSKNNVKSKPMQDIIQELRDKNPTAS